MQPDAQFTQVQAVEQPVYQPQEELKVEAPTPQPEFAASQPPQEGYYAPPQADVAPPPPQYYAQPQAPVQQPTQQGYYAPPAQTPPPQQYYAPQATASPPAPQQSYYAQPQAAAPPPPASQQYYAPQTSVPQGAVPPPQAPQQYYAPPPQASVPQGAAPPPQAPQQYYAPQQQQAPQPSYYATQGAPPQQPPQQYYAQQGGPQQPPQQNYYGQQNTYGYQQGQAPRPPYQTGPADIQENKGISVLCYLGILLLIPLLSKPNSGYVRYHSNQGLLLLILEILVGLLSWIPFVGWYVIGPLGGIAILVGVIMGIINTTSGLMKPLPLIGKITLLK
jgi:uncharacterized membrane protein